MSVEAASAHTALLHGGEMLQESHSCFQSANFRPGTPPVAQAKGSPLANKGRDRLHSMGGFILPTWQLMRGLHALLLGLHKSRLP